MAVLFQKDRLPDTEKVTPEVTAQIVHRFMEKVQDYTEQMLKQKWEALGEKKGKDSVLLAKFNDWLSYHRFNVITLNEIENGDLDDWFRNLFDERSEDG